MLGTEVMRLLDGRNVTELTSRTDITDTNSVDAVVTDVDVVVNCAAYTAVDDAETNEAIAFRVNSVGPANLARRCRAIGARMVQISTDYVFDGTAADPYSEQADPNPQSAYGRTKLVYEWAVRAELPTTTGSCAPPGFYGEFGPNFVKTMVGLEKSRPELSVVDDQRGQPTWARHVAQRIIDVVDSDVPSGIYHATSSGATTWFGFTCPSSNHLAQIRIA